MLHLDGNAMFFCVSQKFFAGREIPFAPWRNNMNVGFEGVVTKLKPYLIIALTRRAVRNSVGPSGPRNLDLSLRNQWSRNARAKQIFAFINCIRPKHWKNKIANELFAQVVNKDFLDAEFLRLLACGLEFF